MTNNNIFLLCKHTFDSFTTILVYVHHSYYTNEIWICLTKDTSIKNILLLNKAQMGYVKTGLQGKVPVTSMMQKNSHLNNITSDFNKPLDKWRPLSCITNFDMFRFCDKFNKSIETWEIPKMQIMSRMFEYSNYNHFSRKNISRDRFC